MNHVRLIRSQFSEQGTFGTISFSEYHYATGELPWVENQRNFSCIPYGTYYCVWEYSKKFKRDTYLLRDVWGREDIRIHPANFCGDKRRGLSSDVEGCIGLGKMIGEMNGQKALLKSHWAVASFEALMDHQEFSLEIVSGNVLLV